MLVIDSPGPAGVHRFGERIGLNQFPNASLPAADDGTIAKEAVAVADVRLLQRLAEQHAAKAGAIDEEVRRFDAAGREMKSFDAALAGVDVGDRVVDDFHAEADR